MITIHALQRDIEQSALLAIGNQLKRLSKDPLVPLVINYQVSTTEIISTEITTTERGTLDEQTRIINIPRDLELDNNEAKEEKNWGVDIR